VEGEYRLTAFGARLASGRLEPESGLRPARPGASDSRLPGFFPPVSGEWTNEQGDDARPALDVLVDHCRGALQRRLGGFLGIQETSNLFGRSPRAHPALGAALLRALAPHRV